MKKARNEKLKLLLKMVKQNIRQGKFKELKKSVVEYFKTVQLPK